MLQQTQTAADGLIKDTTTQTFVKDVIEESKRQPVLIDFWAPWCGPCKQLTPILEKAVRAAKGKVKLVKMNIDEHPAIPGQMGIQSIPAVIAFVDGQPADGFMGALPENQVMAFLERLTKDRIGGEAKDLLQVADTALAEGDFAGAADLYAQILDEDNTNVPALAGLARCYVETGAIDQAKQTLALVPDSKANDAAVLAAKAALDHGAGAAAYAASKAAAVALMDSLAADVKGTGVRVNSVLPSIIDTATNRRAMPNGDFAAWPKPEEIAQVILFLCSDNAAVIHGAAVPVYGTS